SAHAALLITGTAASVALDVHDLAERVDDLHQILRVGHDLLDRLVGLRVLVQECAGLAPRDACHPRVEVLAGEQLPRGRTRVVASGAVRRRVERTAMSLAAYDVGQV